MSQVTKVQRLMICCGCVCQMSSETPPSSTEEKELLFSMRNEADTFLICYPPKLLCNITLRIVTFTISMSAYMDILSC